MAQKIRKIKTEMRNKEKIFVTYIKGSVCKCMYIYLHINGFYIYMMSIIKLKNVYMDVNY